MIIASGSCSYISSTDASDTYILNKDERYDDFDWYLMKASETSLEILFHTKNLHKKIAGIFNVKFDQHDYTAFFYQTSFVCFG